MWGARSVKRGNFGMVAQETTSRNRKLPPFEAASGSHPRWPSSAPNRIVSGNVYMRVAYDCVVATPWEAVSARSYLRVVAQPITSLTGPQRIKFSLAASPYDKP